MPEQQSGSNLLLGIIIGLALPLAYVKFGFSLPDWLQPVQKVQEAAVGTLIELSVDRNNFAEIQRETALKIGGDRYLALDNSLGGFITEEYAWQSRTERAVLGLREQLRHISRVSDSGSFPNLQRHLQHLLTELPNIAATDQVLIKRFLERRFAGATPEEIIQQLIELPRESLLQRYHRKASIWFSLDSTAPVRAEIYNQQQQLLGLLVNARLPAGQYRLDWDYSDANRQPVAADQRYHYRLWIADQLLRTGPLRRNDRDDLLEELRGRSQ
ncbi:hypothetical protein [Motiliproteus sediminis]|uniref:hypothetical protein n=1 Tax=Motiliproteus sediminis TaxID=1468178 RepID=UPI001AEFCE3E|nr:hypothetical protein [Motiliproteus sediminis]